MSDERTRVLLSRQDSDGTVWYSAHDLPAYTVHEPDPAQDRRKARRKSQRAARRANR